MDGWAEGGGVTQGTHQTKTEWGEPRRKERKASVLFFFSFPPSLQGQRDSWGLLTVSAFSARWLFEPWTTLLPPSLSALTMPLPSKLLLHLYSLDSIKSIYIIPTDSLITVTICLSISDLIYMKKKKRNDEGKKRGEKKPQGRRMDEILPKGLPQKNSTKQA